MVFPTTTSSIATPNTVASASSIVTPIQVVTVMGTIRIKVSTLVLPVAQLVGRLSRRLNISRALLQSLTTLAVLHSFAISMLQRSMIVVGEFYVSSLLAELRRHAYSSVSSAIGIAHQKYVRIYVLYVIAGTVVHSVLRYGKYSVHSIRRDRVGNSTLGPRSLTIGSWSTRNLCGFFLTYYFTQSYGLMAGGLVTQSSHH